MKESLWILLIRDATFYTTGSYLERALEREHNVISVPINPWYLSEPKSRYTRKVRKILKEGYDHRLKLNYHEPDLILVVGPVRERFDLSGLQAKTAYYAIDSHLKFDEHAQDVGARDYDFVFVAQKDYLPEYRAIGYQNVHWLPLACHPEIHRYHHNLTMEYDLCFLGGLSERRQEMLNRLGKEYKVFTGHGFLHDMARIYSQSKIVFNHSIKGDLNMRVFEALSCRRLLLTDRVRNGLEETFTDKKHLVIYDDYDDLRRKVSYYLEHPDEREAIASCGQAEVHKHHTYLHRARKLMEVVSK